MNRPADFFSTLVNAELAPTRVDNHVVSRSAMREVLLQIAGRDGQPLTIDAIAEACGYSSYGTRLAIQALETSNLLLVTPGRPNRYTIHWDRLAALPGKAVPT